MFMFNAHVLISTCLGRPKQGSRHHHLGQTGLSNHLGLPSSEQSGLRLPSSDEPRTQVSRPRTWASRTPCPCLWAPMFRVQTLCSDDTINKRTCTQQHGNCKLKPNFSWLLKCLHPNLHMHAHTNTQTAVVLFAAL